MRYTDFIGLGINAFLALITSLYSFFTYKILRANQRVAEEMALQRRDILRPVISIGPEVDDHLVMSLVIKNTGLSPATHLRLSLDTDFYHFAQQAETNNLRKFAVFNSEIPTFAAGSILRFALAQGFNLDKSVDGKILTPLEFKIRAQYHFNANSFDEEFHLDLKPYMNSTIARSKSGEELEKISRSLEQLLKKLP